MEYLGKRDFSIGRIWKKILLILSESKILTNGIRLKLLKMAGVKVGKSYIVSGVRFDSIHPELVSIGDRCTVATGTVFLTHFLDLAKNRYMIGKINVGNGVFIGTNTIFTHPVTIGDNAVIGAGSIVTKDIPAGEVWAGNPARFIKKRDNLKS